MHKTTAIYLLAATLALPLAATADSSSSTGGQPPSPPAPTTDDKGKADSNATSQPTTGTPQPPVDVMTFCRTHTC